MIAVTILPCVVPEEIFNINLKIVIVV